MREIVRCRLPHGPAGSGGRCRSPAWAGVMWRALDDQGAVTNVAVRGLMGLFVYKRHARAGRSAFNRAVAIRLSSLLTIAANRAPRIPAQSRGRLGEEREAVVRIAPLEAPDGQLHPCSQTPRAAKRDAIARCRRVERRHPGRLVLGRLRARVKVAALKVPTARRIASHLAVCRVVLDVGARVRAGAGRQ